MVNSTRQTLGSPWLVRTTSTLCSGEAEPKGCSPLRNTKLCCHGCDLNLPGVVSPQS